MKRMSMVVRVSVVVAQRSCTVLSLEMSVNWDMAPREMNERECLKENHCRCRLCGLQ